MPSPRPADVLAALGAVIDPELGLPVEDLGLIYSMDVSDAGEVHVTYTATSPGCPMTEVIGHGIAQAASRVPGVTRVTVDVVWEPPWTPDRISPAGLLALASR